MSRQKILPVHYKYGVISHIHTTKLAQARPRRGLGSAQVGTPVPKVWKRLGGQDVAVSGNKSFCQKYNIEFLHALTSSHCEFSHRGRNIIDLLN